MTSDDVPEEPDILLGRVVLGRYRIVRELARGGMGAIYLARSEGAASFVKPVVIKRMLPEFIGDQSAARMFKREARIMSALRHPGIVSVFDFGREEEGYLLVMDYVHGFHLGRWAGWLLAKRNEVPVAMAVHITALVLEALNYAHETIGPEGEPLHIVHRDVSPSNVLLDLDGHVRLADFGIAQSRADAPDVKTATRSVKGKFSYMAPEILEGGDPTHSSDLYSAAVVLHELLLGRNEFRTSSPAATIGRVLSHVPTRLDAVRGDCSKDLADVVARALEKRPEDRFTSGVELSRALRKVRGLEAEDADALLLERFGRDFRDPSLAAMYELPDLDELERAWRAPAPEPRVSSSPPTSDAKDRPTARPMRPDEEPTTGAKQAISDSAAAAILDRPPEVTQPELVAEPPRRPRTGAWIAIGVGSLAVVGVVIAASIAWLGSAPAEEPDIVYVEATPSGILPTAAATPDPTDTPDPIVDPVPDPTPEPGTVATTETQPAVGTHPDPHPDPRPDHHAPQDAQAREAEAIQRTFARHTAAMRNCFEGAPVDIAHTLTLHFAIDTRGAVQHVDLSPADVAGTEPGRCVQRIAQAIEFPPPSAPRTFRIPIEVRSSR